MAQVATKEALTFGWNTFKQHPWFLIGVFLVQFFLPRLITYPAAERQDAFAMVLFFLSALVSLILSIGAMKITLAFTSGAVPRFADLFQHYRYAVRYFLASLLYGIMVALGLVLLIIPGVYLALKYQFAMYLIVDKDLGVFAAFQRSGEMTRGFKGSLLGFIVVQCLLNLAGFLFFGVGLLVTVPVTMVAYAKVYRDLEQTGSSINTNVTPIPQPPHDNRTF